MPVVGFITAGETVSVGFKCVCLSLQRGGVLAGGLEERCDRKIYQQSVSVSY